MAQSEVVEALARVPIFSKLDPKVLQRLAGNLKQRTFDAGHEITSEGKDGGVGFFVIQAGQAVVTRGGETVRTLGPGEHFGEMALIDGGSRSATVKAETELQCVGMTAWEFRPFVEANSDVSWAMMQTLVQRLRDAEKR